jgi:hypothetical protein
MDTSLKADTINSMQPTHISQYMLNTSQVPQNKNCTSQNNQINCSVRHYRQDNVIDNESILRGLDRRISKYEHTEPRPSLDDPSNDVQSNRSKIVDSFTPFESHGTREKRACNVLSGVTINRFENPFIDSQNLQNIVVNEPYRGGFQSRLNAKDCNVKKCGKLLKLEPQYGNRC